MQWRESLSPTVAKLWHFFLGIPATHIENERVFSISGLIGGPLRNLISMASINKVITIAKNYPAIHNEGKQFKTVKEFSDFLLCREDEEAVEFEEEE